MRQGGSPIRTSLLQNLKYRKREPASCSCGKEEIAMCGIFVLLPLTTALSLDASARSVSGNISLSTSTTGTRAYLSLILPFDALINASMPLSLDSEILNSASFTAKGKLGGLRWLQKTQNQ
jgi:hypothetical protein